MISNNKLDNIGLIRRKFRESRLIIEQPKVNNLEYDKTPIKIIKNNNIINNRLYFINPVYKKQLNRQRQNRYEYNIKEKYIIDDLFPNLFPYSDIKKEEQFNELKNKKEEHFNQQHITKKDKKEEHFNQPNITKKDKKVEHFNEPNITKKYYYIIILIIICYIMYK